MFNEGKIEERASKGELTKKVVSSKHPSPPLAEEPICTESNMIAFVNKHGKSIALVHCYIREDGTIGASGLLDPKEVFQGGVTYYLPPS